MARFASLFLLFMVSVSAYGQRPDSVYRALLQQERTLRVREDSLLGVIARERAQLRSDTTDLRARSQAILRMEESVFELRNRLGEVASRINGIEQEFILNRLLASDPAPETASEANGGGADLLRHTYFSENLTAEEYRQLLAGKKGQSELDRLVDGFRADYQTLEAIRKGYDAATSQSATDSLYARYRSYTANIRRVEQAFDEQWGERYNQELYLYAYLLDKLDRRNDLTALNERNRDRQVFDAQQVMSAVFAAYPQQRALLNGYELALAEALKLPDAADSLRRAEQAAGFGDLAFPKIELLEKEFVRYENISFPDTVRYTAGNPIPELWIPETGTYYSVTVGTFSQRQAVSIFHGAAPLAYRREGTQWRYFAGLFRSYGDAAEAVEQLREAGFRRPEAVRWRNLEYTNLAAEAAENQGNFRIEIQTEGGLSDDVRETLARYARSKEITRAGDTFYVGTFTDRLQADEVAEALGKIGVDSQILEDR